MIKMKPQVSRMLKESNKKPKVELSTLVSGIGYTNEFFHLHSCRAGPFNANEIYLAVNEKKEHPELKVIKGILQPNASVSKFLNYWLAGLDSNTCEEILLRIKVNDRFLYINKEIDSEILNSTAKEVKGEWENFVEAFVVPLFINYNEMLTEYGYNSSNIENLKKEKDKTVISLEDAMVDISTSVINTILKKHDLPIYKMERFNLTDIENINLKFIPREKLFNEYDRLIEKKKRQYEIVYNIISKEIRSYGGRFPNPFQLEKIFQRCSRIESSLFDLEISVDEIRYRFNNQKENRKIPLPYTEHILLSILAYENKIQRYEEKNSIEYIDGDNMILASFEIAHQERKPLILQEFIRGTHYNNYKTLIQKYPNLELDISSCKTWDTKKFPEFDYNLVRGLKYINQIS